MRSTWTIEAVNAEASAQLDEFFTCLRDHIADNGKPSVGDFQPMSREASRISAEREERFRQALTIDAPEAGWRRLWLAHSKKGGVLGHVDLRGHTERHAAHRCLLGIGVQSSSRRKGIGLHLLESACHWATAVDGLDWIDLQVLSVNEAAKNLYRRFGFVTLGEIPEIFKFDGQHFSHTCMAFRLSDASRGAAAPEGRTPWTIA